jgi:hypothetical protein
MNNENNINNQLEEISKNVSNKEIEETYKRSEAFALVPILKLIYHTTGIDYGKDFKLKIPLSSNQSKDIPIGEIEINNTENKTYKIYLDLVDSTYDLNKLFIDNNLLSINITNIMDEPNEQKKEQLIQIITFLVHSAKLVFDSIKNNYSEINNLDIKLDNNTTIYINDDTIFRLGINIK